MYVDVPKCADPDELFRRRVCQAIAKLSAAFTRIDLSHWTEAYGWGNHAGLYELSGAVSDHESAHDHTKLHDPATVTAAPLTLDGQAITFNYDTDDFQLSGNNLQVKDGGIAHDSTAGVHQNVNTVASPAFAGLTIANGGTIGQVDGPLLTFDDTLNKLKIDGCDVGVGVAAPFDKLHIDGPMWIDPGSNTWGSLLALQANQETGGGQWWIFAGSSTHARPGEFTIRDVVQGANRIQIDNSGNVMINTMTPAGFVKNSATGVLSGGNSIDHGSIDGLTDDDHTMYFRVDGTRAMTGNITLTDDAWIGNGAANPRLVFDNDGYIVSKGADLYIHREAAAGVFGAQVASDTAAHGFYHNTFRSRGTIAVPTAVADGNLLYSFPMYAYDGGAWRQFGGFKFEVDGAVSSGTLPMRFSIHTGTTALSERLRVTSIGDVGIGTTVPRIVNEGRELALIEPNSQGANLDIGNNLSNPGDGTGVGALNWVANQATNHKRLAFITTLTDGGTSSQRGGQIRFSVKPNASTSFSHPMYIRSSGKVGIGTANPAEALDVTGTVRASVGFNVNGSAGVSATYTYPSSITITGGIVTAGASATGSPLRYVDRGDPAAWDFAVANFTTDGTWRDLDLSSIVPAGAVLVHYRMNLQDDLVASEVAYRKNGNSNGFNATGTRIQVANQVMVVDGFVACDSGRIIEYWATNTTFSVINFSVRGWWIPA